MPKILFYTDTPQLGGAEKQMLALATFLKHQGVFVDLAYGKYSRLSEWEPRFSTGFTQVFPLNVIHKHDPRHFFELRRVLRAEQPDALHLHLWNPGACRWAFLAARSAGVPVVTTEHDPFLLKGWKFLLKKICLRLTRFTIAVSRQNRDDLRKWYGIEEPVIRTVHNGIETERFMDNVTKIHWPTAPEGCRVIVCVAELHERKGHRYLLDAFFKLQKTDPLLRLALVGAGPLDAALKRQAQTLGIVDKTYFLGWRDDVPAILAASDVFVLPSLNEAFGLSVAEAMAAGLAVVATKSGGIPEIVENDKSGLLVPPASSDALAGAIERVLKDAGLKRRLETAAWERVRTFFSAERMARDTLKIYQETIG